MIVKHDNFYYGSSEENIENFLNKEFDKVIPKFSAVEYMLYHILENIFSEYKHNIDSSFKDICKKLATHDNQFLDIFNEYQIHPKKSIKYRLGNGLYFVYNNMLFASKYTKAPRTIIKVDIQKLINNEAQVLNLLDLDTQYKFYKMIRTLKNSNFFLNYIEFILKFLGIAIDTQKIQQIFNKLMIDVNFDTLILDYWLNILDYGNKNGRIKVIIGIYQESGRALPYTNQIFENIEDNKSQRNITGITPNNHLEIVVRKNALDDLEILDTIKEDRIANFLAKYDTEFKRINDI